MLNQSVKTIIMHIFFFSDAVTKMDDLACKHILDRMEAIVPSVKAPTDEVFGSVADRALTAAESYLEYFMPDAKGTIVSNQEIAKLINLVGAFTVYRTLMPVRLY